jgi:sugar phosphate isomerase/epimerase
MAFISRREAGKLLLTGCAGTLVPARMLRGAVRINSVIRGVQIGAQSFAFRDLSLDACIDAYREVGLGVCELFHGHIEPADLKGEAMTKWRLTAPDSYFKGIPKKFDDAGIFVYAYDNSSFRKDSPDVDIERGFQMAKLMGAKAVTTSTNISVVPRIDRYAQTYKMRVGFHGSDRISDPDAFSNAESYKRALKGASPYLGITLDIGHFVAAGGDPVGFLEKNHEKIVTLHIKDRKKNRGPSVPWGQGDTPIVAVLQLLRDKGWKFPANIEYDYGKPGMDSVAEVKKCFAYCKQALES